MMLAYLLSAAEEKDYEKIIELYEDNHNDMLRLARSRCKRAQLPNWESCAEDAVQNAFLSLIRSIGKVEEIPGKKKKKAYILATVSHEVAKIIRSYEYCEDLDSYSEELASKEDFVRQLEIERNYKKVVQCIAEMDEKYAQILLQYHVAGKSAVEIANDMGIPVNTVYTRLHRGRELLIKQIGGEIDGDF